MVYEKSNLEFMARLRMAEQALGEAKVAAIAGDQARYQRAMRRHDWAMERQLQEYPARAHP